MSRSFELDVWLHGRLAGVLTALDAGRMRFAYEDTYRGPLLSLSLREADQQGAHVRNWFANLLPEGDARAAVVGQERLNAGDDFGLLTLLGRDCAGAVVLLPRGETPPPQPGAIEFEPVSLHRIEQWAQAPRRTLLGDAAPVRLSLAGAQYKAAVLKFDDGTIAVPTNGAPSSHILKIPNRDLPDIVTLEAFGMRLAAAVGMRVAAVELLPTFTPSLLVQRYDRIALGDGRHARVHQEDFCQALGVAPENKYEEHGGPGFATVFENLRRWGSRPDRLGRLLQWTVFNVILGNADAHAKNLSLIHDEDETIDLAPAYDLVPSGSIAGLDRRLAMRVGDAATIDAVTAKDWDAFGAIIGIGKHLIRRTRSEIATRVIEHADAVATRLAAEGASVDALERVHRDVVQRASAVEAGLAITHDATRIVISPDPWQT